MENHYLTPLFAPRSIIVFAGDCSRPEAQSLHGRYIAKHLRSGGFNGRISFLDSTTSGTLGDLAQSGSDLAIIALPNNDIAQALEAAGRMRSKAALVVSTGVDATLAADLHAIARRHALHLIGPNCMGFQRPGSGINASVLGPLAPQGALALIAQSGALTASILDWSTNNGVGFSTVVSLGPNTSVDIVQVLDFLIDDRSTQSIVVYMEGIRNARRFMSSLRAAANAKPVVVLKAGRKPAGSKAALTHSGAIVGSDDVFDAALQRAGAVRVRSFVELFSVTRCLASRYLPTGIRLAIVTNGGGPGVLAADRANDLGLELATLPNQVARSLAPQLSPYAQVDDLIDLAEEATPAHYRLAMSACAANAQADGILVILSPKPGMDSTAVAQVLVDLMPDIRKPLISCWMGEEQVGEARNLLNRAGIPTFRAPEAAVDAFSRIATFHLNQQLLQQTPPPLSEMAKPDIEGARILIENVLAEQRKVLTEMESKALLSAFHIPVTKTILARSSGEAILVASQLGYPVALKIDSSDVFHKSDVQGVALNIQNAAAVRDTWTGMMAAVSERLPEAKINGITIQNMSGKPFGRELYIGVITDEPFGPVISFGAGGTMIELIADRAIELPPLNHFLAQRLIDRARAAQTLNEWRGALPANREALVNILLRVSEMVCALPQLREMDINPVIVDADGAVVVDARVVIDHAANEPGTYHHLAILPYPSDYESNWPLRGGGCYTIRPIHPDDAEQLQEFVKGLSGESRYFRFAASVRELSNRMLARFTLIDYDREMALVAVRAERVATATGGFTQMERIIGVSRYVTNPDSSTCEFSLVIADEYNAQGLGSRMMLSIMDHARNKGLSEMRGLVLSNNLRMLKLMRRLGFTIKPYEPEPEFRLCVRIF